MAIRSPDPIFRFKRSVLAVVVLLQLACSIVFIADVISEWDEVGAHTWVEAAAVMALVIGAALGVRAFMQVLHRNRRVERELDAASGAFQSVIEHHFEVWGLTKAERDVALLSIKGVSIADIARMRDTREGTIKAQNAAIYRKAGVSSRADLISTMIEDLIGGLSLSGHLD